ncbi:NHLP family bacteriocin export ABC transporter peptidase/permease/ATPase subunit [Paenibacillus xylanexedens]|uniref:NHLP family bacteriocin export ABC transporter peptidase/permease/ATPase subunit n=1 Tax=Paenibacillus xylanexedens TaxID=528191 RepID=UPI00093867CC|nr:NHLP family bacteriocin export ABC transporter peptidase/permease/ATPase subunit [Paenibacillus xylanexedens]APO43948.1 NHLP family bacteriocin export ABC transporter peptidase/permease/ATPase subunit [Paenibacillus xylanexedens]
MAPRRVKTPTVLQMEAVECGAASLSIVLSYYKSFIPLEELRISCGVSRDGSKANNILKAARQYGMEAKGYRKNPEDLRNMPWPVIIHWNFNHFLVLEGIQKDRVFLNDPVTGPREITFEELDQSFTGVVLTMKPAEGYVPQGKTSSLLSSLSSRIKGSEKALVYAIIAGLFLVLPGLVIPVFSKIFIDQVLLGHLNNWLFPLLVGMGITALLRALLIWLQRYYLLRLEMKLALSSSSRFFWHVLRLPIEFFSQRHSGDIASRVAINDRVAQLLSGQLAVAALNCVMILFYLLLMLQYSVLLAVVTVGVSLLNVIFMQFITRKRNDQNLRLLQESGKMQGVSMNGLQVIETLKSNSSESDFFVKWSGYQAKLLQSNQQFGVSNQFLMSVPTLLTSLGAVAVLFFGGFQVMDGALTIGSLVAFQSLAASFSQPVNEMVMLAGTIQEAGGSMKRLDDVLQYPVDRQIQSDLDEADEQKDSAKLSGQVQISNLTYGYSKLEAPLIDQFNLSIQPGMKVALVGGSGSGKSTIAKLIAGIYEPWEGDIRFDDLRRDEISRHRMGNSLAVVDQEIVLLEGTIKENITFWDATIPETDVVRAAKDAVIHDHIAERSGGYDHMISENGGNFSGGQRQRLEIARALSGNPSILILDEATSALDPATEKLVDDSLRRRGLTCITVAHRLSTIRDADEIIVLERGKIIERGTHTFLMEQNGYYTRLIQSQ